MGDIVGTVWRINDSLRKFVVVNTSGQYAVVENLHSPVRRRRILISSLRSTHAKHGYTQIANEAVS